MWTSYEAICELGGPIGNSDEADDPQSIFGVDPPSLSPRHTVNMEGGVDWAVDKYRNMSFKYGTNNNTDNHTNGSADNATVAGNNPESGNSFALNRYYGTPSTPYSTFDKMSIGIDRNQPTASVKRGNMESDIRNHLNRPATGSTIAPRSRTNESAGALPQTNLFNVTPAVGGGGGGGESSMIQSGTPVTETPAAAAATAATTTPGGSKAPASAISYADQVLTQARRVAAGQYYQPSPETTPSRRGGGKIAFDSRFNDVSAIPNSATAIGNRNARLWFSTALPSTPNLNAASSSPFHAGLSSVKGEKRALSPSIALESTRKKQEKVEENVPDPVEGEGYELDSETERDCVGRVLRMLSTFGAAYKYLCQVSDCFTSGHIILGFITLTIV